MARAHEACPYSRATRGNIEVTLTVGGVTEERRAAKRFATRPCSSAPPAASNVVPLVELARLAELRARCGAAYGSLRSVVPESQLVSTAHGLVPKGQGWFVLNARETHWWERKGRGVLCEFEGAGFEGAADFLQLGINLTVLSPGEPMAMYHRENDQEDFLVLAGEALAIVESEERPLRRWDFVHCPPGTSHVIIGAGEGPCLVLAVGARDRSRGPDWGAYTVDRAAQRHGAGVERETTDWVEAYARFPRSELTRYREGWLPE